MVDDTNPRPLKRSRSMAFCSPMITLIVGGKKNTEKTELFVHRERLIKHDYFRWALQKDSSTDSVKHLTFEDEDPALFSELVEYFYKDDIKFLTPLIVRLTDARLIEEYTPAHRISVITGASVCMQSARDIFNMLLQLLDLGDRYSMPLFVECIMEKFEEFPIGVEEFTMLFKRYITTIGDGLESQKQLSQFLLRDLFLHFPRLQNYEPFNIFVDGATPYVAGKIRLSLQVVGSARNDFITETAKTNGKVAICIKSVSLQENIAKYGLDDGLEVKFGAAKTGDVFATDGTVDERGVMVAMIGNSKIALPADVFTLLEGVNFHPPGTVIEGITDLQ